MRKFVVVSQVRSLAMIGGVKSGLSQTRSLALCNLQAKQDLIIQSNILFSNYR